MSSQITTPLATYKILNAIDNVRKVTENEMDYYVEMISIASGENITYKYRVYVNYINGVKFVGDLYKYKADTNSLGSLVDSEQIPGAVLSHGKLFSTSGTPYYVEIRSTIFVNSTIKLINDNPSADTFCILSMKNTYDVDLYTIDSFYYYPLEHRIEKTPTFVKPVDYSMTTSTHISCLYVENKKTVNGVFYLDEIPSVPSKTQLCYRILPKQDTTGDEEEPADPETGEDTV